MHQQDSSVVVCVRQFDLTQFEGFDSIVSITRFCYPGEQDTGSDRCEIQLPGRISDVVFAGHLEIGGVGEYEARSSREPSEILGLEAKLTG
jgi:hypothetical protein